MWTRCHPLLFDTELKQARRCPNTPLNSIINNVFGWTAFKRNIPHVLHQHECVCPRRWAVITDGGVSSCVRQERDVRRALRAAAADLTCVWASSTDPAFLSECVRRGDNRSVVDLCVVRSRELKSLFSCCLFKMLNADIRDPECDDPSNHLDTLATT